jgi:hypothetical protein
VASGAASRHPQEVVCMVSNVIKYSMVSITKVLRRVEVKRRFVIDDRIPVEFIGQEDSIL